ncbi:K Homology domain [Macleaya cordata]|uniref:K Homology domain n=1 Tax=Macleaya cordata TaxID=56857 RepID=A0A200R9E9_MACCD|nr:K Homology domain [Macleaya cordata]
MATATTENGSTALPASEAPPETSVTANAVSDPPVQSSSSAPDTTVASAPAPTPTAADKKWPGWPGDSVFRLIVPVIKVGSIIGRKGELIKKMCEETKARIRVLEGAIGTADRIVLISGKEEPEARISPAMNAVLRVFKRVTGISETEGDGTGSASVGATCSIRLLVASSQAINLIGKQGSLIKSIQENTGASVRVLSGDEVPHYATSDERIVEIQGESLKVLKALEAVVGHLRKFLVDHSVIPLFEKSGNAAVSQDRTADTWPEKSQSLLHSASQPGVGNDYPLSLKREPLYLDREPQLESHSSLSLYGQDPALAGLRSSGLGRSAAPIVTQVTQTMQIPLSYAEDIIGIGGANIGYIRRTSGAILTVQESRGLPDEITVEIKGTSSQVQTAQQLIHEFIAGHKEPTTSNYGKMDTGLRSYGSQLGNSSYQPSSLSTHGGYGPPGVGGYSSFRL